MEGQADIQQCIVGNKVLVSITGIIFEKVLLLSNLKCNALTTGEIDNIIQTDVQNLYDFFYNWCFIVYIITNFIFASITICIYLGLLGLFTFFSVALYFLLNYIFSKKIKSATHNFLKAQDRRLKYSNEILSNIKAVIMNDWSGKFEQKFQISDKLN